MRNGPAARSSALRCRTGGAVSDLGWLLLLVGVLAAGAGAVLVTRASWRARWRAAWLVADRETEAARSARVARDAVLVKLAGVLDTLRRDA